jgi:lipid A ethanolaminephosphotransferase
VALFLAVFHNYAYFKNIIRVYADADNLSLIVLSTAFLHFGVLTILLSLCGFGRFLKSLLIIIILVSSSTAYFIDTYNVVIDRGMIENVAQTTVNEAGDLLSLRQLACPGDCKITTSQGTNPDCAIETWCVDFRRPYSYWLTDFHFQ